MATQGRSHSVLGGTIRPMLQTYNCVPAPGQSEATQGLVLTAWPYQALPAITPRQHILICEH
jgi:hypothetical protein